MLSRLLLSATRCRWVSSSSSSSLSSPASAAGEVAKALAAKGVERLDLKGMEAVCREAGVREGAEAVCDALQAQGALLRVRQAREPMLASSVFLRPQRVGQVLDEVLDVDNTVALQRLHALEAELEKSRATWNSMGTLKGSVDAAADRYAQRVLNAGLAYFVVQTIVLADLTFDIYAWDVTEPICFFASSITVFAGFIFYLSTRKDYTFADMRGSLFRRKQKKLFRKRGFDENEYDRLGAHIQDTKREIDVLERTIGLRERS